MELNPVPEEVPLSEQKADVASLADPRCLSMSDLTAVPVSEVHHPDTAFALESLRHALSIRSGAQAHILSKEYVLFKASSVPTSNLMISDIRLKKLDGDAVTSQTRLWFALQRARPLLGTVARPVSLLEAFSIARFGDITRVDEVHRSLCDKFTIKDATARSAEDIVPVVASSSSPANNTGQQGDNLLWWSPSAADNNNGLRGGGRGESSSSGCWDTTGMQRKFTPKPKKKAPLARVLKHLARYFQCHIIVPVCPSPDADDDVVLHFAPTAATGNTAADKNPRIVVLRPTGDVVIRQNSVPTRSSSVDRMSPTAQHHSHEENIFVSPISTATWQCAFLDHRPDSAMEALSGSLRRSRRRRGGSSSSSSSSSGSSSGSSSSSSDSSSSSSDGDGGYSTSSCTSSDDDDEYELDKEDRHPHHGVAVSPRRRQQRMVMTDTANPHWTSPQPHRGKYIQSVFDQQQRQQAAAPRLMSPAQGGRPPASWAHQHHHGHGMQQGGDAAGGCGVTAVNMMQNDGSPMSRPMDVVSSDNIVDTDLESKLPPLRNIVYPTIDGSVGVGMLLKATLGSDSPLFANMRTHFYAGVITIVLTLIFASAYLGTTVPSFGTCCIESSNFTASGKTAAELLQYAQLFCPVRQAALSTLAASLPPTTTAATTSTTASNSTALTDLQCAQRVCLTDATVRSGAITVAKFGDAAGGPVEIGSHFLFAAVGPVVVIMVLCVVLLIVDVFLMYTIARFLAIKAHTRWAHFAYAIHILLAACLVAEAAALVAHADLYQNNSVEPMTNKVDCSLLPDDTARQLCQTGADCGVQLHTSMDISGDTLMGLAAMLLILCILVLIAAILYPFPSEEEQRQIQPSRPSTLIFTPGTAAPDGLPVNKVVKIQQRIGHRVHHIVEKAIDQAKVEEERKKQNRVYGERPESAAHGYQSSGPGALAENQHHRHTHERVPKTIEAAGQRGGTKSFKTPSMSAQQQHHHHHHLNHHPKAAAPAGSAPPMSSSLSPQQQQQQQQQQLGDPSQPKSLTGKPIPATRYVSPSMALNPKAKPIKVFTTDGGDDDDDKKRRKGRGEFGVDPTALSDGHVAATPDGCHHDDSSPVGGASLDLIAQINAIARRVKRDGGASPSASSRQVSSSASHHHHHHSPHNNTAGGGDDGVPAPEELLSSTGEDAIVRTPQFLYESQNVSKKIDSVADRVNHHRSRH